MDAFLQRYGFRRREVGLHNWRQAPFSRFAFGRTREIVPTAQIRCGTERAETPPVGSGALAGLAVEIAGATMDWQEFLRRSHTDVFVAMKGGRFVAEWVAPHADAGDPHILFSVTKSVSGLLAGILEDQGVLDMAAPVSRYLSQARGSAFEAATLQQLVDMRTSLDFDEDYLNSDGDYARYRRATGWNPLKSGQAPETMTQMILSIRPGTTPHGGPIRYASPNTDLLGLVIEQAAGSDYCRLLSRHVWQPLGARTHGCMTLDGEGAPRAAGGMCATARDLARLAETLRKGGEGEFGRIISTRWIEDMLHGGDVQAWRDGNSAEFLADGRYRNCWYQTGYDTGAYCAFGIHGQWAYVDPEAGAVLVKLSSQPIPMDDELDQRNLKFFRQVCRNL